MSIRVYRYGLLRPTENADLVRRQMRLAHEYRNTLVQIERGRRAAVRESTAAHGEIAALEQAWRDADEAARVVAIEAKAARAKDRTRKIDPETKERIGATKNARKEAARRLQEARAALRDDPVAVHALDEINERAARMARDARALCGVFWGSYLIVEAAMQASRGAPLYDAALPNDPRFVRWAGEGAVGVQIQHGLAAERVFGSDTRLRVDRVDGRAWHSTSRGERRRLSHTTLRMRVSSEGRDPVWAAWPMVMHRPLPDGGTIKTATVHLRMRGPREEWSVEITVAMPDAMPRRCGEGAVGMDIGWRLVPGGVRVAAWHGDDGERGELVLTDHQLGGIKKADDLRSIRDKKFDAARTVLAARLGAVVELPPWLAEATKTLAQWRAPARLAALAKRWRAQRWDGDGEMYDALEAWRYDDYHLWTWEVNQRVSAVRARREVYRIFGSRLAARYATVAWEDFDLRPIAKRVELREERENEVARANRQRAAVSELRRVVSEAFVSRGGAAEKVPAHDTTRTCHACGLVEAFDAATNIMRLCPGCGAIWDQDENAAKNILRAWRERPRDASEPGVARSDENQNDPAQKAETRWEKARRMRREKTERMATARKVASNTV